MVYEIPAHFFKIEAEMKMKWVFYIILFLYLAVMIRLSCANASEMYSAFEYPVETKREVKKIRQIKKAAPEEKISQATLTYKTRIDSTDQNVATLSLDTDSKTEVLVKLTCRNIKCEIVSEGYDADTVEEIHSDDYFIDDNEVEVINPHQVFMSEDELLDARERERSIERARIDSEEEDYL